MAPLTAKMLRLALAIAVISSLAWAVMVVPAAGAATITVDTTTDDTAVNGNCTLREAIIAANTDTATDACPAGSGADTIMVPAGTYTLTIAGTGELSGFTGDLNINADVTIKGAGRASTIIDANGLDGVLVITNAAATISGLTLTGGDSGIRAGSGINVYTNASLTLSHSRVTQNGPHGGIFAVSSVHNLNLEDVRLDHNTGTGLTVNGATLIAYLSDSVIDNNSSDGSGGGVDNSGGLNIVNSTISGNSADADGGGLASSGSTNLYNVTVANNTADADSSGTGSGGGLIVLTGTLTARNSLIGNNIDNATSNVSPDCWGNLTSAGYNLIEDTNLCAITGTLTGNVTGVAPKLEALAANGGGTLTHALKTGSPAIDGGDPVHGCVDQDNHLLTTDQRGFARNGPCDIGAYEFDSPGLATATATRTPSPSPTRTRTPMRTPTRTATATVTATQQAPHRRVLYVPFVVVDPASQ